MAKVTGSVRGLDFREFVRPGDGVLWGQACAEPVTLVTRLLEQRHELPGLTVFLGIPVAGTVGVEHTDALRFTSYTGAGGNADLQSAGALEVLPSHYSTYPQLIRSGLIRADVVLVQLSAPDDSGRYSLGLTRDYLAEAVQQARVLIGEVNPRVPWTNGGPALTRSDLAAIIGSSGPPAEHRLHDATTVQERIAHRVAGLIDDGATLQLGVGDLVQGVLPQLTDRRRLGIHSGQISDGVADLMQAGVITGESKTLDRDVTVTGMLLGSQRLFDYAHHNPRIQMRDACYTHHPDVLAGQERLIAVNSAVEVDLTGQVNAEAARGRYIGSVGGAIDFLRGAARSRGGQPIVMLPATAGPTSRIVARLNGPVSTPRSDAGLIVTEHGVADLRGKTLEQRTRLMIEIAAPEHRASLESEAETVLGKARPEKERS